MYKLLALASKKSAIRITSLAGSSLIALMLMMPTAMAQSPPEASRVNITLLTCAGVTAPTLSWSDAKKHEGSQQMTAALPLFRATLHLPEGSYNIVAGGGKFGCAATANILVLAGHKRDVSLVPYVAPNGTASVVTRHKWQLGGSLPFPTRQVFAKCKGDGGESETFSAYIEGEAYYFDRINAWRCTISLAFWGDRPAVTLPSVVDLRPLGKTEGFVRRDITAAEVQKAAGI